MGIEKGSLQQAVAFGHVGTESGQQEPEGMLTVDLGNDAIELSFCDRHHTGI